MRKSAQPVPQAEPGVCCSTRGHVPPHSTQPFPMLQSGCSSPGEIPLPAMLGWFYRKKCCRARGQAQQEVSSNQTELCFWVAEQCQEKQCSPRKMDQERFIALWGWRKMKVTGLATEEGGDGGLAGTGLRDFETHWSSRITLSPWLSFTSRNT